MLGQKIHEGAFTARTWAAEGHDDGLGGVGVEASEAFNELIDVSESWCGHDVSISRGGRRVDQQLMPSKWLRSRLSLHSAQRGYEETNPGSS